MACNCTGACKRPPYTCSGAPYNGEYIPSGGETFLRAVRPATDMQLRSLTVDAMFSLAKHLHKGRKRKAIKDALLPLISNKERP